MSIVDLPLSYTKDELIEALRERRKRAEVEDAEALASHEKAEQEYLKAFRRACREAAKWDYATAKEFSFTPTITLGDDWEHTRYGRPSAPRCDARKVSEVDSAIEMVQRLRQDRFTLARGGKWFRLYHLLTDDVTQIEGLC